MTAPALTYPELLALRPCIGGRNRVTRLLGGRIKWNGNRIDAAEARAAGVTYDDIIWVASALSRKDKNIERRLRLWAADCAAHVLPIFEDHKAADDRPRKAIIVARQFARGKVGVSAHAVLHAAYAADATVRDAAYAAARTAAARTADAARAAYAARAARDAAYAAARAARDAAYAAVDAARDARDAAADVDVDAEQAWQFDRLIAWLSDVEPADWPLDNLLEGYIDAN